MACAYPWVIFHSYYTLHFMFFYLLKATSVASYSYIPCGCLHPLHVVIFPINLRPHYWQFKDLIRDMTAIYVSFHDLSTPGEANSSLTSSGKGEKTKGDWVFLLWGLMGRRNTLPENDTDQINIDVFTTLFLRSEIMSRYILSITVMLLFEHKIRSWIN